MTTKPKARRFRLRLGDESAAALRTHVAPQRPEPARPESARPEPARPDARRTEPAAAEPSRPAERPAAEAAPARPASAPSAEPAPRRAAKMKAGPGAPAAKPEQASAPEPAAPQTAPGADSSARPAEVREGIVLPADGPASAVGAPAPTALSNPPRNEEFSGRQLRMAMRVAHRNGIKASSELEAVRLLRERGIDPFETATLLDIVKQEGERSRALTTTDAPQLPKAYRQPAPPATAPAPAAAPEQRKAEISQIQKDIARRRRRRMTLLAARLGVFVILPTLIAAWYFFVVATPLYATNSEFVIQQADSQSASSSALGGMFAGAAMGSNQDSLTVQSFLQSRDAMRRLSTEEGFKTYFQQDFIDPLRRLPADATDEATYRLYQDMVQVSFDPTEGIIRMEVVAADPEASERFARALVSYAEEQVDQLTQRLRENQMSDAQASVESAEARMNEAQMRVLELQERFQMLSSEVELTLLTQQITTLEAQLNVERLDLEDLRANARPNPARLQQGERRVASLQDQIARLRGSLTQSGDSGQSIARLQSEQVMAQSDVATRQMLLAQAMQQLEAARIEANRQVRYLSLGVTPIAPDEPTYPRAFEATALAFLIFSGIYLLISMTAAILREQVTG